MKKIREKRPSLQKKKIIFHQDNALAHKSVLAMGKLRDLHYELLEHPPYSPDLALALFSISSLNSNFSSLVSVFLQTKRRLQL
jgi:histone-lysine N-methyltransferase SETMAR